MPPKVVSNKDEPIIRDNSPAKMYPKVPHMAVECHPKSLLTVVGTQMSSSFTISSFMEMHIWACIYAGL